MLLRFATLLMALAITLPVHGQNLLTQLPEDGTSARYLVQVKGTIANQETSGKGMLSISSVGTETVQDEPCRWIEIYYEVKQDQRVIKLVEKILVPEKYCAPGQDPLQHIVKGYVQRGDRDPTPLNDSTNALASPIPILLAGPLQNPETLKDKLVESKLGKLPCKGTQGDFSYQKGERQIQCKVQTWQNAKAPFGVIQADLQDVTVNASTRFSLSLVLNTVLQNSRSRLPDLK